MFICGYSSDFVTGPIGPISLADFPLTLEYVRPWQAALLFLGLSLPIVLLGIRSLVGLGPVRRWVAVGIRMLVLLVAVLVIAGARWQRQNKDVEVIVLRDISQSTQNMTDYPGQSLTTSVDDYLKAVADGKFKKGDDRIGVIGFSSGALIDAMPNTRLQLDQRAIRTAGNGTDVAGAIQLALATFKNDALHRVVLISDGNPTSGDLDSAISSASSAGVPIDVMPLDYDVKNEVLVENFIAPAWKRENEPFTIEIILRSTNAVNTTGKLTVTHNDQPMDMDPSTPGIQPSRIVTLQPGRNPVRVLVPPLVGGNVIHQFKASFEGENVTIENQPGGAPGKAHGPAVGLAAGDTLLQNNTAQSFTFVRGKGKVLYIDNVENGRGQILRQALESEGINLEQRGTGVDNFPKSLIELQNYDAVILANVPRGAGGLDDDQQKMLANYVHDMGGGLVMIGGDQTFGAGGWGGSKLEEILPVNMDIPAQRQMPKGALVLVMHSCEMPQGNFWGEQCAIKAIETLSYRDEIGIISYSWGSGGAQWDFPLAEKGNGDKVMAAVKNMQLGDMPDFDDTLDVALNGKNGGPCLKTSDARQKHIIIISDGDPQPPKAGLVADLKAAKVTVSTVSVYPHDTSDQGLPPNMQKMARDLGGRAYGPINANPNQLPQIFIKEATVVRRSLIMEDKKGMEVKLTPSSSELIKGLGEFPSVYGMVLTSRKPNPQIEVPLVAGKANPPDPLLAHWQTGLGKAVVWTSDAHNRWAANWVGSSEYAKFWSQVVRSVSRPPMSADFDVKTTQVGDKGKITVEALNRDSAFLNFLSINGQVIGPDGIAKNVKLVQTGPGTYEGEYDATDPGTYVAVLNSSSAKGEGGLMLTGMSVNSSPELRDLKSNDATLRAIADRTRGRMLDPFKPATADLFTREGLKQTASPLPIWDLLVPVLLALIILDVATRRIAWDWLATKKLAIATAERVRGFTVVRKVETRESLDALKRIREESAQATQPGVSTPVAARPDQPRPPPINRPDPKAKFEAATKVEGDITNVVGGATDKPVPPAPKDPKPKGAVPQGPGASLGGLMAAKRRAQEQIRQKEQGEDH